MSQYSQDLSLLGNLSDESGRGKSLYERFGGRPFLERLNKVFYDKIYADDWMSGFFSGVDQKHIENQQSDFLAQLTGGPKKFGGRMPSDAHVHIMITEELFMYRHKLYEQSLTEIGTPEKEKNELLKIDMAFLKVLKKNSLDECKGRYKTEKILDIPKPFGKAS